MRYLAHIAGIAVLLFGFSSAVDAGPAPGLHRIGFLTAGSERPFRQRLAAFRLQLDEIGYHEGKNLAIEERYAGGRRKRLPALAAELVGLGVRVIVTNGGTATKLAVRAAKQAGKAIPVIFAIAPDPVGAGLVASLARPGGMVTGVSNSNNILVPKRLALLKETVPNAVRIAVLYSARARSGPAQFGMLEAVAPGLGVTLIPVPFDRPDEFESAFAAIGAARPDALNVLGSSLTNGFRKRIAARALKMRLPVLFSNAQGAAAGGLISYGAEPTENYRRAAAYVDKILKGAKPADLPVERPTQFYLTLNLRTAKALDIAIPRTVLLRAERVIE